MKRVVSGSRFLARRDRLLMSKFHNNPALEDFLASIERQAYRVALFGTGHPEDALDVVQETMIRLVEKYALKPVEQWKPLFYRILHNQIKDLQRKRSLRSRWQHWFPSEDGDTDPIEKIADPMDKGPERQHQINGAMNELEQALEDLPFRQRQTFLLRAWEGLSVAETALAMKCSEGSIKTHYSRALGRLRQKLGEHWP